MRLKERISTASLIAVGMAAGCCLLGSGLVIASFVIAGDYISECVRN